MDTNKAGQGMAAKPCAGSHIQPGSSYVTVSGDNLWCIAQRAYGQGKENDWHKIYEANKQAIGSNPDLIHIGLHLHIPHL